MKATLTFNLPEEANEHQTALDGWKWKSIVEDLADKWRTALKYDETLPPEVDAYIEKAREELFRDIEYRGLNLYE